MTKASARQRMTDAAFTLFAERGYDSTTVEDITGLAGVGRMTFFRTFGSKEDVVFPDHDAVIARIEARLAASTPESSLVAVAEASRLVLEHYLEEGEVARVRYALTSVVPALRAREIASAQRYRLVFKRYLRDLFEGQPDGDLRADLMAAAVVAGHNHVLRRWLRGETAAPLADLDNAMAVVAEAFARTPAAEPETTVVVIRSPLDVDALLPRLRNALEQD